MGIVGVKIKIMPESPNTNLEDIKIEVKKIIESKEGKNVSFEEELIAFGLKALIVMFAIDEQQGDVEGIENSLGEIQQINSVKVIDMRRAFG